MNARPTESRAATGVRYTPFCSLDVRHDYCATGGGGFGGLRFVPSGETQRRFGEHGILFRPQRFGFDLLCESAPAAALQRFLAEVEARAPGWLTAPLSAGLLGRPFLFDVLLEDSFFFNFTASPPEMTAGNPVLHLSNRRSRPAADGGFVLDVDWERPLEPLLEETASPPPPLPPSPAERIGGKLDIALPAWAARRGDILRADAEWNLAAMRTVGRPFGLLSIHPAGTGAEPVRLDAGAGGFLRPVRYTLHFAARSTYWRYIVAARSGEIDAAAHEVVDGSSLGPARFERQEPVTLPDGREAATFVSPEPLPMQRRVAATFALQRMAGARGRRQVAIPALPVPGADTPVVPHPSASGSRFYSDMYVFV